MARMLGRKVWDRVYCSCCNGPRSVKVERAREKRQMARELRPEGLLPTAEPDDGDWAWKRPRSLRRAGAFLAV